MWADLVAWLNSSAGMRVVQGAIVPALAIVVAGVVAALIGRAVARGTLAAAERERATTAIAGLVETATASIQGAPTGADRRRIARLRLEADVRTRMLALPNADLAAQWAEEQIVTAIGQASSGDPGAAATVAHMRDRLVEWTSRPGRARRLFAPAVPAAAPGPRRSAAPEPAAVPAPSPESVAAVVPAAAAAPDAAADLDPQAVEAQTAPVLVQRTRRAFGPVGGDAEPPPVETRAARHARPPESAVEEPVPAAAASAEESPAAEAKAATPPWLDTYDDEAQVTQNMNLKTPPPVAAAAVRDRAPSGANIVPRG